MDKIQVVWLMEYTGTCLFKYSTGAINEPLFTGFISSIQKFLKTIGEKIVQKVQLGDSKLTISHSDDYNLITILKSPMKIKDKFLEKKLKKIQLEFIIKYGADLIKHQVNRIPYNIEDFQGFNEDLKEIIEEK